jgi:homoserine dehydrogenase
LASKEKYEHSIDASVRLVRLPLKHPLAAINGVTNAITYSTGLLGDVTLIGPGAGRLETGYALVSDLLAISRKRGAPGTARLVGEMLDASTILEALDSKCDLQPR